ncbi:MAG: EAL domain-containing protein [Gammaproteobacteria bacterium]|nr:EAL domain-containing protein [Gammaproteobacteria bacterium]
MTSSPLYMMTLLFVLLGIIVLVFSLYLNRQIYNYARDHLRSWWILPVFNIFFLAGFIAIAKSLAEDTATYRNLLVAVVLFSGSCFVWIVTRLDRSVIAELTRTVALERHRAIHDELTRLPNRTFLTRYLDKSILRLAPKECHQLAVLMIDLDRFKEINDTMGHSYGDILLQEIALRLHRAIRKTDMLARLGGDEFGVLLDLQGDHDHLRTIAGHIVESLTEPFAVDGRPADVGMSIGVAWYPDDGFISSDLLNHARIAMHEARNTGEDMVMYDRSLERHEPDRLNILSELDGAIENAQLVVHYQPQIDLKSGKICGVEALVRWPHPRLGLLSPDEFIPLAEHHGLINRLSYWVLEIVLAQLQDWCKGGINLPISTNISAANLQDQGFHQLVLQDKYSKLISSGQLKLEITESELISNHRHAIAVINLLLKAGVQFSIDDFGTGYSSLQYLKNFPVHEIKIDKSFVVNMDKDNNDATIVQSTIELAHKLGRHVTAEGVESKETLDQLKRWDCDRAQGFYLGQPQPIDELKHSLN